MILCHVIDSLIAMVTVMLRARPVKFSDYKFGKSYWDLVMASMPSIITFLYTFNKDLTVKNRLDWFWVKVPQ